MSVRFGLTGAAGYVAPRHMRAMAAVGGQLIAALDPHDGVGVLDQHFSEASFFTDQNRFERFLEKERLARGGPAIDWLAICSPNHVHDAHVRLALRAGASALCEKPLTISPWNLDALEDLEARSPGVVRVVLQLRHLPAVIALRERVAASETVHDVELTYVTRRGRWYDVSWKGDDARSGGVAMNIGIHFFDLLLTLFGGVEEAEVHLRERRRMAGALALERARVRWFLSVEQDDLPPDVVASGGYAHRSLSVDGAPLDLSANFLELHQTVYEDVLGGGGVGIADARASIALVQRLREADPQRTLPAHPMLAER